MTGAAAGRSGPAPGARRRTAPARVGAALDAVLSVLAVAVLLAIVGIVVLAVVMRYGPGAPLVWSYDVSTLLFGWMVFLGLALAERDRAHLAVDVIDAALGPRAGLALALARQAALVALSLVVAWFGWKLAARAGGTLSSLRLPIAWLYASLPVGFALLALAQALTLLRLAGGGEDG